jgi:hypothetical protein
MRMLNRFWCAALLGVACSMTCTHAQAQCGTTTQGFNTVWGCQNNAPLKQGSFAMVDAGQFGGDICKKIFNALSTFLSSNPGYGVVVDARGVPPPYSCSSGETPWGSWGYSNYPPSVVLLPSGTIPVVTKWIMPANARLIGEGPGATILQAANNFTGDMIDMGTGSSSYCTTDPNNTFDCPGVEIEHLALVGNSQPSLNGIVNNNAQEFSYVEDVAFSHIMGTALWLNGRFSQNSGPYSNLTMTNVGICVNINGPTGTRGIHGLNCSTSNPPSFPAAIYVDASNNSLEDISLSGANTNGILIGSNAAAQNNVLFNISGSGISGNGFTDLIHISSNTLSGQTNCPGKAKSSTQVYNVCDVTIMAVTNSTGNTTIKDDVGGPTVSDSTLGMYILGEPVQYGDSNGTNDHFLGSSHFTTSPNWPSWVVGPSQTSGASCAGVGSLYSVVSGSGPTLWECEGSGWQNVTNQ